MKAVKLLGNKKARILLVQEDYATCSLAEHIAYCVYNKISLKSKIRIISSKYATIPFSPPPETFVLPQTEDIKKVSMKY